MAEEVLRTRNRKPFISSCRCPFYSPGQGRTFAARAPVHQRLHFGAFSALLAILLLSVPCLALSRIGDPRNGERHSTPAVVKIEKVAYLGLSNCYRLSNSTVEVIVTTDVGPRIIRYAFIGGDNILGEVPDGSTKTELGEWKARGGHRLWAGPEAMPRTYSPDNSPIEFKIEGNSIRLTQPVEPKTGIEKEMTVTLDASGSGVRVHHRLTNRNLWAIDLAPWALTIMHGGGVTILPQEPYKSHDEYLLPARPLVFWYYTNLSDPRWTIGKKYIQLRTDEKIQEAQKIGIGNKQGWAAYLRDGELFVKRFPYHEGATYADYGCNNETYTSGSFMEIESLGPMTHLEPGQSAEHDEHWNLFKSVSAGTDEGSLERAIAPLINAGK